MPVSPLDRALHRLAKADGELAAVTRVLSREGFWPEGDSVVPALEALIRSHRETVTTLEARVEATAQTSALAPGSMPACANCGYREAVEKIL